MNAARLAGWLIGALLVLAPGLPAGAQMLAQNRAPAGPAPDTAAVEAANGDTVGVISGGVSGTYVRIAADLASVLDNKQLRVLAVIGKGSLQNISDILYLHGIDIGIVQSDVLAYAERQKLYPNIRQQIGYITKLYEEEVHILARRDITSLADLAHQKVNIDLPGSGTAMTASVLFDGLGIPAVTTNYDQDEALEKLERGELAAIVYVVGKPARLFTPVPADSGLHFLSIPITQALLDTYVPAQLRHDDYPTLIAQGAPPVDTVAVGSVMAVYNWPPSSPRYAHVARFVDAFFSNFQLFQQPPRHPKWRDVNLAAQVPGWTRFPAAQQWLQRETLAGTAGGAMQADFSSFLTAAGGSVANLSNAQKTALFQQFLQWENARQAAH